MVSDTDAFGSPEPDALELVLNAEPSPQPAQPAQPAPEPYESETVVLPQPGEPEPVTGLDLLDGVDPEPEYVPALIDSDDGPMLLPPETVTDTDPAQAEDTLMAGDDYGDVL
ncbi:hypothetical protein [Kineosporia sp. NBRC 101731]|uniref:hypothetical protein n=1 Tax=Kineosporia sp. NBRC 101731 TaxID=3032199 RepID=UPI0024A28060|nr:hypothetical protein [Kineosporia sp. NBRC 101731]GLY32385.1 hypothetical protein Kisp02_57500 [Kineosporia sp. NBRC 101731]